MSNKLTKFLRRVGGGTSELDHAAVGQKTRNWYTALGAAMLIVATISSSVAGLTWGSVIHNPAVGVAVAIVWFGLSLCLNYMMAAIIDAVRDQRGGLVVMLLTILIFGALVSAINTNFIMLRMLDAEIQQKLQADYQTDRTAKEQDLVDFQTGLFRSLAELRMKTDAAIQKANNDSNTGIAKAKADVDKLQGDYQYALSAVTVEVDGRANSKQIGDGSRAKQKRAEAEEIKALLATATARLAAETARLDPATKAKVADINASHAGEEARLQSEFKANKARVERNIKELDLVPRDGFINRDLAMWSMMSSDKHLAFLFMAFFFILECIVGLVKILMGKTDYHLLLESMSSVKMREFSETIAQNDKKRLETQAARREEELKHRKRLRDLETAEHMELLEVEVQRRAAIERHLEMVRTQGNGLNQEEVDAERIRLLKAARKNGGSLKLVGGRN